MVRRISVVARLVLMAASVLVGFAGTARADDSDTVSLHFSGKGKVMAWGFEFDHTVKVASKILRAGGKEALEAIFKGAPVKGDDSTIAGADGTFEIGKDGAITGKVTLNWEVSGNPKSLTTDITGTAASSDDGKTFVTISFKSTGATVKGSWSHGKGNVMETKGTADFTVETVAAEEKKTDHED